MAALPFVAPVSAHPYRARPSASECVGDVIAAMHAVGVHPIENISSRLLQSGDKPIRFRCEGDKPGRKNGWAYFSSDPLPFAAFGNWRRGVREYWTARGGVSELSAAEREAIEREIAEREIRDQKKHVLAAQKANDRLAEASPASSDHPYLQRKRISGEKLFQIGDELIVPISDIDGRIASTQTISATGEKRFLTGGKTGGNFWLCGRPGAEICIGEGMATMAAVRRATGFAVIAAMNANNLVPVAKQIRARRPHISIIICADDDEIGIAEAEKAAKAVGGKVVHPLQSEGHA